MRCCTKIYNKIFLILGNIFSIIFLPILILYLLVRIKKGKEEIHRIGERFGFTTKKFIELKPTIWLHAASVGETVALINLLRILLNTNNYNILLTTGTVSSAKLVKICFDTDIKNNKLIHQYNVLDFGWCLNKFLKYWQIKLAINCESELWPNKIFSLNSKNIRQIIINATMSDKSFTNWMNLALFSKILFSKIDLILAQTEKSAEKYQKLGAKNIKVAGNLKTEAVPYITEPLLLNKIKTNNKNFIFWAAISTHKGEDELILRIHKQLKQQYKNLKLILVPRHIERCAMIINNIVMYNFSYICKTNLTADLQNIDIILGDTIGDIGFFLSLSHLAFIGKSLDIEGGGHNPIEPILMKVPLISGNKINNFLQIYEELQYHQACYIVENENELFQTIKILLDNARVRTKLIKNATNYLQNKTGIVEQNYKLLQVYLNELLKC